MHEKAKRIDNLSALISLIIYILSFVAIIWHYFY